MAALDGFIDSIEEQTSYLTELCKGASESVGGYASSVGSEICVFINQSVAYVKKIVDCIISFLKQQLERLLEQLGPVATIAKILTDGINIDNVVNAVNNIIKAICSSVIPIINFIIEVVNFVAKLPSVISKYISKVTELLKGGYTCDGVSCSMPDLNIGTGSGGGVSLDTLTSLVGTVSSTIDPIIKVLGNAFPLPEIKLPTIEIPKPTISMPTAKEVASTIKDKF